MVRIFAEFLVRLNAAIASRWTAVSFAAATSLVVSTAHAEDLRIGFLNTTTGSGAIIGTHLANGWKLGLEHQGWMKDGDPIGGVPTSIFYADDQAKPDVGLKEVEKFLKRDKVHIVAGIIWSNVIMTIQKPIFDAGVMILSTNSAPSPLAGELCNPLFTSSSLINAGSSEAAGEMATADGVKTVVALAPNYQAGKDNVSGFRRTYRGEVLETILFKFGESDFQADLARLRAMKPQAALLFAPGAMGVSFMKQWLASGLGQEIKLYTASTVDQVSLPSIGDAALGTTEAGTWNPDLDNPKNKRFQKDYVAKFGHMPSYIAVQSYDAPELIAKGVRMAGGRLDDMAVVARAIRKGEVDSPRGRLKYNVNGVLIQPYWRLSVVKDQEGKLVIRGGEKVMERPDAHWQRCPPERRI